MNIIVMFLLTGITGAFGNTDTTSQGTNASQNVIVVDIIGA